MDKLQIDKKIIIDLALTVLLILGALMFTNEQPGGLLITLFSSFIWSLLLLSGIFFLFKSKDYDSNMVWASIVGILVFIVPLSYSFRILSFPGNELFTIYAVTIIPLLIITFAILLLLKRKTNLGSYYLNTLIRLVVLLLMCFFY